MNLQLFRHLWGVAMPWEESFPKIKALGYSGIETVVPQSEDADRFADLLSANSLKFIATAHTHGESVDEHLDVLRRLTESARTFNAEFVAAQAGADWFDDGQRRAFYTEALKFEKSAGIAIAHETHRGRPLYNPWATLRILDEFPTLKLVADLSHWVCVCERLLDDCLPIIRRVAGQTLHIHGRVGYSQGPQVPDPRAPEAQSALLAHERWWDMIWDAQEDRGFTRTTLCPEFGPPLYLQTLPHTNEPVANLWDIVEWQAQRQKERFGNRDTRIV